MPPSPLYKYLSLAGDDHWNRLDALLRLGRIYFSSPDQLNDPIDVRPMIVVPESHNHELWQGMNEAGKRAGDSRAVRRKRIKDARRRPRTEREAEFREIAMRRIREVGVFCVTTDNANGAMWAHYADTHRGICVGFHADRGPLRIAEPVIYTDERPQYDYRHQGIDRFRTIFLTKGTRWVTESEYRLVSLNIGGPQNRAAAMQGDDGDQDLMRFRARNPGPGIHGISRDLIASITFGYACPVRDRRRIAALVQQEGLQLGLFEMHIAHNAEALAVRRYLP